MRMYKFMTHLQRITLSLKSASRLNLRYLHGMQVISSDIEENSAEFKVRTDLFPVIEKQNYSKY